MAHIKRIECDSGRDVRPRKGRHVKSERDDERDPAGHVRHEEHLVASSAHEGKAREQEHNAITLGEVSPIRSSSSESANSRCNGANETGEMHRLMHVQRGHPQEQDRMQEPGEDDESASEPM